MRTLSRRTAVCAIAGAVVCPAATARSTRMEDDGWVRIPLGGPRTRDRLGTLVREGDHVRVLRIPGLADLQPLLRRDALPMIGGIYEVLEIEDGRARVEREWVEHDGAGCVYCTVGLSLETHDFELAHDHAPALAGTFDDPARRR